MTPKSLGVNAPTNNVHVDYANNEKLKAMIGGWEDGKKYTVKMELLQKNHDENAADFTILEWAHEMDEADENSEVNPDGAQPVDVVIKAGTSKEDETPKSATQAYVPA